MLYRDCRCSQRIIDHLLQSARPTGFREFVLFVGKDPDLVSRLRKRGFEVVQVSHQTLKDDYRIEAAPLFVVLSPDNAIEYMGGYTRRKQGPQMMDVVVMRDVQDRQHPKALPLFGCGVSRQLQSILDPLGIKYDRE